MSFAIVGTPGGKALFLDQVQGTGLEDNAQGVVYIDRSQGLCLSLVPTILSTRTRISALFVDSSTAWTRRTYARFNRR